MDHKQEMNMLIDELLNNPEKLREPVNIAQANKRLASAGMFGAVLPKTESYANFSVVNLREDYMKKLLITSLVGYLFRTLDEYDDFAMPGVCSTTAAGSCPVPAEDIKKDYREQIRRFLARNFVFNPDRHVKQAKSDPVGDSERELALESLIELPDAAPTPSVIEDVRSKTAEALGRAQEHLAKFARVVSSSALVGASSSAIESANKEEGLRFAPELDKKFSPADAEALSWSARAAALELKMLQEQVQYAGSTATLLDQTLPSNVFYHFNRYMANNYEALRQAVKVMYHEKPDIEFMIQYYDHFATPEAAKEHQIANENNLITSVYTIKNGGWTLLGPFNTNRDRVALYNKDTKIIEEMAAQLESDQRQGAKIMKDRVVRAKADNIAEHGLDSAELEQYTSAMGVIEALGKKPVLSREEKEQMAEAQRQKEAALVPKNALQVDYFAPDAEGKLQKHHFYTKAEGPAAKVPVSQAPPLQPQAQSELGALKASLGVSAAPNSK